MKILDNYVYRNLKKYKNCYISEKEINKFGKKKILEDLKENGFDCKIQVYKNEVNIYNKTFTKEIKYENDYVVEVV